MKTTLLGKKNVRNVEQRGKRVFEWKGGIHADSRRYMGAGVCSYIPGPWERDIDQLFTKIQQKERFGL